MSNIITTFIKSTPFNIIKPINTNINNLMANNNNNNNNNKNKNKQIYKIKFNNIEDDINKNNFMIEVEKRIKRIIIYIMIIILIKIYISLNI